MASLRKEDLRALFRNGFTLGYSYSHDEPEPTVKEIDSYFESALARIREQRNEMGPKKINTEKELQKWVDAGRPKGGGGVYEAMNYPDDEEPKD
jgi:hypothetical protein